MGMWKKTDEGYGATLPFARLAVCRCPGGWDWEMWCRDENVYSACMRAIPLLPNAISECEAEYLRRFSDQSLRCVEKGDSR